MSTNITIQEMTADDWTAVAQIYADGIATGEATFETDVPTWEAWDSSHLPNGRFVAQSEGGEIVGWAALSPVSSRCVYAGVAEVSVYVAPTVWGQGVGKRLLQALVDSSEAAGIWMLQASIFPENEASVKLHEKCGFRIVGRREKLGQQYDRWRDVLFMERRSQKVGLA
ncbi:GNAT family N-acetyltransferase [Candidatus Leptofilum sp.]|uniref:GNAT family N-acetyltransferase n=1 Tax=Candidatus Leptofilum sp. TaxID=3241576 RepID=UPI003B5B12B6